MLTDSRQVILFWFGDEPSFFSNLKELTIFTTGFLVGYYKSNSIPNNGKVFNKQGGKLCTMV
jgi:hypothetical protein